MYIEVIPCSGRMIEVCKVCKPSARAELGLGHISPFNRTKSIHSVSHPAAVRVVFAVKACRGRVAAISKQEQSYAR